MNRLIASIILLTVGLNSRAQPSTFNKVFVLGNSITLGFGTHGMAASNIESDYFYFIQQALRLSNIDAKISRSSGSAWEGGNSQERNDFIENVLPDLLQGDEDLIIVQLGDNVNSEEKRNTFTSDAKNLVAWFHNKSPNARIAWVYGWYQVPHIMPLLKSVQSQVDMDIVDISDIRFAENGIYQSAIGNIYINSDGVPDTIKDVGVAGHPGDLGMKEIASRIINQLALKEPLMIPDEEASIIKTEYYSLTGKKLHHKPKDEIVLIIEIHSDGTFRKHLELTKD
jgi:hypothetical protein